MQRRRNSSSATEPGGRIALRLKFFFTPPAPRHREEEQAKESCQQQLAAADGRIGDLAGLARQEPEREGVVGAILDAVEADEALALAEVSLRVGGALAALEAKVAIRAAHRVAIDSPEREPAEQSQERAQRADRPAEEPGNPPVGEKEADENEPDDPGLPVLAGLCVNALGRLVHGGQHAGGHRSDRQRDRVEQTDLE